MSTVSANMIGLDRFFVFCPPDAENRAAALDKKGVTLV